jgi:alkylresorcinol/alkylpyrone synthase
MPPTSNRARIASTAMAFPDHVADREATAAGLRRLFPEEDPGFVEELVERSGVERRRVALPVERLIRPRDFSARQAEYVAAAERLAHQASAAALSRAGLAARDVDVVIDASCTGVMLPALDVPLAAALGLRADVRRIPITETGCAAGALATGLAADLAANGACVLVLAVELCTLAMTDSGRSRSDLVAGVLFGDGAAAAVVRGDGAGPRIRASGSHLFPGTRDVMGFDVGTHGLRLILQRELPLLLERGLRDVVVAFLARHGLDVSDVGLHLVHPGGRRVLESYAKLFELPTDALRFSWQALREYGNLSSAAVLSVLDLALSADAMPRDGRVALLTAFGPGMSAEMLLLDCEGAA